MRWGRWPSGLAIVLLGACGGGDTTDPGGAGLADLVGSWQVTSWEYSLAANPSQKADWVTLLGLSGSLTITGDGDFTVIPRLPGGFGQDFGHLTREADSLYWDGEDDEEWVHYTLGGRTLTLFWPEEELVDMDQDGVPEHARLRVLLDRS